MTYDSKCYDLAREFLEDNTIPATHTNVRRVACAIQQAIEDELEMMEKESTDAPR